MHMKSARSHFGQWFSRSVGYPSLGVSSLESVLLLDNAHVGPGVDWPWLSQRRPARELLESALLPPATQRATR